MLVKQKLKVVGTILFVLIVIGQGCSPMSTNKNTQISSLGGGCQARPGVSGSPGTIAETVNLINALPKPVTIPCFLASLDRPLRVSMTSNPFSAQPAAGRRSPRIFIMIDDLFLSIVPDGQGAKVIEMSELTSPTLSVKAEVAFPVEKELTPNDPFSRIRYQGGTACAACHGIEQKAAGFGSPDAFESLALQPRTSTLVPLLELQEEWNHCDQSSEPERCALLDALFDGAVESQSFPSSLAFF